MKKIIGAWAFILAFTACQEENPEKLTLVLDWSLNTNHTGAYVARDLGYFKNEGLEVEILLPPETGALGALLSEKTDLIYSYQEEITLAGAAGQDVVAVAAVLQQNTSGFASPKGKAITRPKDFEGKTYGGWGSPMEEAVLKALMEGDGADFSRLKMVNMGSMDFFTAVDSAIDFAWIFQGWTGVEAQIRAQDLNYIDLRAWDSSLNYYTPVIAARGQWLTQNPEKAKKALRALAAGYVYAAKNPQNSADILLKAAPELNPQLVKKSQEFLSPYYLSAGTTWGTMEPARWEKFTQWLATRNLLANPAPTERLFTNDYLP